MPAVPLGTKEQPVSLPRRLFILPYLYLLHIYLVQFPNIVLFPSFEALQAPPGPKEPVPPPTFTG